MNDVKLSKAKLPNQQGVLNICEGGAFVTIKPVPRPPRKGALGVRLGEGSSCKRWKNIKVEYKWHIMEV